NLSNEQIGKELDLDPDDAQRMTTGLREGVVLRRPEVTLRGEVECDEVYVVAGPNGHPPAGRKKRRLGRPPRLKGGGDVGEGEAADLRHDPADRRGRSPHAGRRPAEDDRPAQQGDDRSGERGLYRRVRHRPPAYEWGYEHHTVCHAAGEFARDEDGDG